MVSSALASFAALSRRSTSLGSNCGWNPNATLGERQPFDASGVGFRRDQNDEYVVDLLVPGSAAAADLREGDVLVSIDDRSAVTLTRKQLALILSGRDTTCALTIRREGELRRVTLKLRERL
jgi:S1-C subfamily serine protease